MKLFRTLKKAVIVAAVGTMMTSSLTVFAAVKTMPDGGKFDPQYYASTYPDVAAAFGTDETALYNHYKACGKAEGRKPYADADAQTAAPAAASTVNAANAAARTAYLDYLLNDVIGGGIPNPQCFQPYTQDMAKTWKFGFYDVNKDGIEELLLGYYLFFKPGYGPIQIDSFDPASGYAVTCWDMGHDIVKWGQNGEEVFDLCFDDNNFYPYVEINDNIKGTSQKVSSARAQQIEKQYTKNCVPMSSLVTTWYPLSKAGVNSAR